MAWRRTIGGLGHLAVRYAKAMGLNVGAKNLSFCGCGILYRATTRPLFISATHPKHCQHIVGRDIAKRAC